MRIAEIKRLKGTGCNFCDRRAVAVWMNGDEPQLSVCRPCAVHVLLSLLADAIWMGPIYPFPNLDGVMARFWQCYAKTQDRYIRKVDSPLRRITRGVATNKGQ